MTTTIRIASTPAQAYSLTSRFDPVGALAEQDHEAVRWLAATYLVHPAWPYAVVQRAILAFCVATTLMFLAAGLDKALVSPSVLVWAVVIGAGLLLAAHSHRRRLFARQTRFWDALARHMGDRGLSASVRFVWGVTGPEAEVLVGTA